MSSRPALAGAALLLAAWSAAAQPTGPKPDPVLAVPLASPAAQSPRPAGNEPVVERIVIDEKGTRIEELHVRGEVRSIKVQPKQGAAYEIVPATGGRDLANSHGNSRGAAGQRVWPVLSF